MIYVVDSFDNRVPHINFWTITIPQLLKDSGHDVTVVSTNTLIQLKNQLISDSIYKHEQFSVLLDIVKNNGLNKKDIIIFSDSHNQYAMNLFYLLALQKKRGIKMVGIWKNGLTDHMSPLKNKMLVKSVNTLAKTERYLYQIYDVNFFSTLYQMNRFFKMTGLKKKDDKICASGYPLNLRSKLLNKSSVIKENIVVIPHDTSSIEVRDRIVGMRGDLVDYEFIDVSMHKLKSRDYYNLLSRAKVVMYLTQYESDVSIIYSGIAFGCIPIAPNTELFSEMLPNDFLYDNLILKKPFLNFVRGHDQISSKIRDAIENYESYSEKLSMVEDRINDRHFNELNFLNIINNINNES